MLLVSCLLHAGFSWLVAVVFRPPALGIEFQVPIDVELGLSEELAAAPLPAPAPPPEPEASAANPTVAGEGEVKKPKPKPKPKPEQPKVAHDGGVADGGELLADPNAPPGSRLPPGAQIAVRVDMARIRTSPIAADIRGLLAAIPDWQALLDGSGIDPVDQLDRLLIATPNLQRAKVVIAGRFVGEPRMVDEAVQHMAEAHGGQARWHQLPGGIRVAPWLNADETPREIAVVGPSHFTISRPEDLERVLAIAAARAQHHRDAGEPAQPADALLSMEAGEGLSLYFY
jgi:hypothetical protein